MTSGLLTPDHLRQQVASGRIDTVLLAVADGQGRLKGKEYDASVYLDRIAGGGAAEVCAYVFATDVEMRPVDGFALTSWDGGYGDLPLEPVAATARLLPWLPRTALVLADALGPGGQPLAVSPRTMLRRQLDALAEHGLRVKAGVETEFTLYHGPLGEAAARGFTGLTPVAWDNRDYALDQPRVLSRFSRRLRTALAGAGLPVEAVKTEGAPGQVEVTFPYGDALAACDGHLLFKHATRAVAERCGLAATFMAAPADGVGNGLHLHLSLWRGEPGEPGEQAVLADAGDGEELSGVGRRAVAGLLEALPQLVPLYAPTTNSYKRYQDHSFAPTRFGWGRDNRGCAVRVVGHGAGLHLEIRLPGADANPYLALAAVLAAVRHGLEGDRQPPKPVAGDAYRHGEAALVPRTLHEALAAFQDSALAARLLGAEVAAHYAQAARIELDVQRAQVTDVERRRGFAQA
ncbi:glutamine synthetase family protein [Streptacidiphilus sp. PB12-B1b]|uniref:glutamine synthetase family protein n=1 Tax=Streptacidiphilus sp. PB12-B1b TaxID=2705012 RepID=UPI001CDCDBB2|nr:glutamine synthetase family protein [Streptacidiphilus sp. PB12-B1b]